MGELQLGDIRAFQGEHKSGFFGSHEHISVSISVERVVGRGYRELENGKYEIVEFQYLFSQLTQITGSHFDKKPCTLMIFNGTDKIFLPDLNVLTPTLESIHNQFKDLLLEDEAANLKRLILSGTFTKQSGMQIQDEVKLFQETVLRLKELKKQGFINPMEYNELRDKLLDFYA